MGGRGRYSSGTTESQLLARWGREAERQSEYRKTKHIINNTKPKEHQPMSLENYEPVALRLSRLLGDLRAGGADPRIITVMLSEPGADICVFRAELWIGDALMATGHAEEVRNQGNVNKTSHVENCETSSLGRMCESYSPNPDMTKRPSREEMSKVQRVSTQGNTTVTQVGNPPSDKQLWLYKKLLKDQGKLPPVNIADMDKFEVSRAIEALKAGEQPAEELPPEEPF
jgi:hypothetical protein